MPEVKLHRALISAFDKTGLVPFARSLALDFGVEILSTGGTAALLREAGVPVRLVEDFTDFPELMNGRVKTLHPKIHAAILADRANSDHMRQLEEHGIEPIDLVVVNLYPFEATIADPGCTLEQAVEIIDIGGPCMLRAAAKNHRHVLAITSKAQYARCLDLLAGTSTEDIGQVRREFAEAVFQKTSAYDGAVADYLQRIAGTSEEGSSTNGDRADISSDVRVALRYGENPHQKGFYRSSGARSGSGVVHPDCLVSGSELSFNNYVDATASWELCAELNRELPRVDRAKNPSPLQTVVFVKHTNACGVGVNGDSVEAYRRAYLGDPNAAMGGVLSCSFSVTRAFAEAVMETYDRWGKEAGAGGFFVEVWTAPSFESGAIEVIQSKKAWGKRVRLLAVGSAGGGIDADRTISRDLPGGVLEQTPDALGLNEHEWTAVSSRSPCDAEWSDLRLAWLICKHTKSNAITICRDGMLLGNGAGQMSRVMSCRIAAWSAKDNGHSDRLAGSAAASDAFFPFPDGPNILMDAGVSALIQPGGSKRDEETVRACDERDVALILTGTRHFRH